ncbi:MAG TPA: glycosyltransferase, partial [Amaricoccus sp.]|nr:glycosyltransferase [Amaricoccus sp.]
MQVGRDFRHVILTRFNLATPGRESAIRNQPGWLAGRFELFERYCLPTLAAQTVRDFRWIVYFDEATPAPFRARIEACRRVADFHPYFTPIFPGERWGVSVRGILGAEGGAVPWLLSTRLDNDDGLAVDFVARVQAAVAGFGAPRRAAFNVTNGYVFDGRRAYALGHPSNAFASLLEPWEAARTVSDVQHMRLAEEGPVVQVAGPGGWLQVVHGGNVSNKIRGRRVPPGELAGRFPPAIDLGAPASAAAIAAENLVLAPLR